MMQVIEPEYKIWINIKDKKAIGIGWGEMLDKEKFENNEQINNRITDYLNDALRLHTSVSHPVQPEVMPKFMETIEEWEETMKMHIDDAIDKQEQQISEHYYKGREDAAKYAIEMIHKHLKLNKLSA